MGEAPLLPGFVDPVLGSQAVFRGCTLAMSRPGTIVPLGTVVKPPPPLSQPAASLVLTLVDVDTALWLDARLAEASEAVRFLRFHTGARVVRDPKDADFAVVSDPGSMPPLAAFKQGTDEYPDRSTTLIVMVDELVAGGCRLVGPGIDGSARLWSPQLPQHLIGELHDNRARFPRGVDIVLAGAGSIAALPRSVRVQAEA